MTGFASASREGDGGRVQVTLKAVNHRFLDLALKVPQACASVEGRLRALLQQRLTRGRVELLLAVDVTDTPTREVVVDERLLDRVAEVVESARDRGLVTGSLQVSDLLRLPQVFEIRTRPAEAGGGVSPALLGLVDDAMTEALDSLVTMRETEGGYLAADLNGRLATIAGFVDALEREAKAGQVGLEARLRERLAALPTDLQGDPAAVAQELVRWVARSDIDEELVRLRAHFEHWRSLSAGDEACGRKLDFLVQEMNREINTIGSKLEGAGGTAVVIDAKAELERIREQAQNVE